MPKLISKKDINKIRELRLKGYSLPEIKKVVNVGYGSIYRYIKDVKILPQHHKTWFGKRGGSIKRKILAEENAKSKAKKLINSLTRREKLIFFSAIYWGEGSKGDFGLSNTDPEMISILIKGLNELFNITESDLRISIRIYEDLERDKCLNFWSKITGVKVENFVSVNVLSGNKKGKLSYGMCRVRIRKGGGLLKYIKAIKNEVVWQFLSPHSSTDRA